MAAPGLCFSGTGPSLPRVGQGERRVRNRVSWSIAVAMAALLAILALDPAPVAAQSPNEQLFVGIPDGWQKVFDSDADGNSTSKYVPAGETVGEWSEMLTLQRYPGVLLDVGDYIDQVIGRFIAGCLKPRHKGPEEVVEGAYQAKIAFIECRGPDPLRTATDAPSKAIEFLVIKAIQGREALYVVRRAWHGNTPDRHPLNSETAPQWVGLVKDAELCDLNDRGQTCRSIGRTGNLN